MRTRLLVLALLLSIAACLLAACGGSHHKTPTRYATRAPLGELGKLCPAEKATLGCSIERPKKGVTLNFGRPPGCLVPDDYEGNTGLNYAVAKPFICGAIIKAGEGNNYLDHAYATRLSTLRALHIWHAPYWFVRGGSCTAEGNLIVARLRATGGLDSGPLILDSEVPSAFNMAVCLARQVFAAFHRWAVIYTSPGTWPGGASGGLAAWIATFGPSHSCLPWTCSFVAWQFAAPPWVLFSIPGMGTGDVSVDQGITHLVPPPVVTHCLDRTHYPHNTRCLIGRYRVNHMQRDLAKVRSRLDQFHCHAAKHPGFCGGWFWAQGKDIRDLATLRRLFA